jgi:parvulin-like peptidyl-prolyl isomerase
MRNLALEELVVRELAYQQAKKMGLIVSNKEIASSFKRIRNRYKTAKDFDEALKAEKITEKDLEQRIERDLLLKKINQLEIEDRARVGEAEAKQHYAENKAKFLTPVSLRLWNIVVKVEAGKEAEAKRKVDEAYKLLREGKDFYGVAYKYSTDDYSFLGGDYGWVHRGQLAPDLEAVVFTAKENEITGPFQTGFGWHLIKVGGVRPEKQLKYEEVKEKIKKGLYQQRIRQTRIDFTNRLKSTAAIVYNNSNK